MKPLRFSLATTLLALGVILALSWTSSAGAQTLNYSGKFKFQHNRMQLVDMWDKDHKPIGPPGRDGTPIRPAVIDKKGGPQDSAKYEVYPLSETGGFILRFVLQKVEPALIKNIYMANYNVSEATAISDINKFLDALTKGNPPILVPDKAWKPEERVDPQIQAPVSFKQKLIVDVSVDMNQMGGGGFKIPPY